MPVLEVERADGYAVLTLNRPEAKNALSRQLRSAVTSTVRELEADPEGRALILTGAGGAFCAGLDLKELGASASNLHDVLAGESPVDALHHFSGPIIGAINGAAITGAASSRRPDSGKTPPVNCPFERGRQPARPRTSHPPQ